MHRHLIEWFRNVHIHPDPKVIEQRWKTAQEYGEKLSRASVPLLVRLFLFPKTETEQIESFSRELLALDKEFPVTGNTEEVRLMAGVVMVTTFGASSLKGDAFALGLRAATFPGRAIQPAQSAILAEAETYLQVEAERQRPGNFLHSLVCPEDALVNKRKVIRQAAETGDAAKIGVAEAAYIKLYCATFKEGHDALAGQIRRLAEESALLWWVLGEYSTYLKRRVAELTAVAYALVAAAEAADRTHILPPPFSSPALLSRALKPCKSASKKSLSLIDFLGAADPNWRKECLKSVTFGDCTDLVPTMTGLAKLEEFGELSGAEQVFTRLCPGLSIAQALSASEATYQIYSELMFLRALRVLEEA
jgi:hypothetical protein